METNELIYRLSENILGAIVIVSFFYFYFKK